MTLRGKEKAGTDVTPGSVRASLTDEERNRKDAKEFGDRLRSLIPDGMSQATFATDLGSSEAGLKNWLTGKHDPGLSTLRRMAQVGGVTLGWLADGIVTAAADARAQDRYLAMLIERAGTPPDPEVARQVSLWREMRDLNAQLLQSLEELERGGVPGRPFPSPGSDVNTDALAGAMAAVDELIQERKLKNFSFDKRAQLTAIIYKQLTKVGANGQIDKEFVGDLLDAACR